MKKDSPLKTIVDVFVIILVLFSVIAIIVAPIFLIVSTIILSKSLPLWFIVPSYILSSLGIVFLLYLLFRDKEDKGSQKNHMLD